MQPRLSFHGGPEGQERPAFRRDYQALLTRGIGVLAPNIRGSSPLGRIDRVVTPTLVLHGANDINVPVVEAEQVVDSLERRGVPVEYVRFPDEGDGFQKTANRVTSTAALVEWFERYLVRPAGGD